MEIKKATSLSVLKLFKTDKFGKRETTDSDNLSEGEKERGKKGEATVISCD